MEITPPEHEPRPYPRENTVAVERLTQLVQVLFQANLEKTGHYDHSSGRMLLYETVKEGDKFPQVQAGNILKVTRYWGSFSKTRCELYVTTDNVSWTPDPGVPWPFLPRFDKLHQMYLEQQSTTLDKYEAEGPNYFGQNILKTEEQQLIWNPSSIGTLQRTKYTHNGNTLFKKDYQDNIFSDAHQTLNPVIWDLTDGLREILTELNEYTSPGEQVSQFSDHGLFTIKHFLLGKAAELKDTQRFQNLDDSVVIYAHRDIENQDRIRYKPFTITQEENREIKIQAGTITVRLPIQTNHSDGFLSAIESEFSRLPTNSLEDIDQQHETDNLKDNAVFQLMVSYEADPEKRLLYQQSFLHASRKLKDFDQNFTGTYSELIYTPATKEYTLKSVTKCLNNKRLPKIVSYKSNSEQNVVPTIQELYLLMELLQYYSRF